MPARQRRQLRFLEWIGGACALLAAVVAVVIVSESRGQRTAMEDEVRERNRLRMLATREHIEDHMGSIWLCMRLISLAPHIVNMSPGPYDGLRAVHKATYPHHRLTEIYVTERDFDGKRHPFLMLTMGLEDRLVPGHHTLESEAEEYEVHVAHIRRFAEDPSLGFLVSHPVQLCIGEPGIVCSVPVRSEGELAGIVAGMVPSDDIGEILDTMSTDAQVLLANDNAGIFTCFGFDEEMRTWFQERFAQHGVAAFFEDRASLFRVGNLQAMWTRVDVPGGEDWYVVYVYDEADYMHTSRLQHALAGWGGAGVVLLLGGAVMFLCRVIPALAAARARADMQARELVASEARTRAIVDTAADGIVTIDERGIIESFNRTAALIFGYTADEVVGRNVNMLMPPPESVRHDEYLRHYLRTGAASIIGIGREVEGLRKDGAVVPLELAVSEVRLADRRRFTGLLRDISARKQAEKNLKDSEERYRTLVQNIELGVTLIDIDYNILMTNTTQGRMFNRPCCEFVHKKCYRELEKRDAVCAHCPGARAMASGKPAEAETEGIRGDGSRFPVRIQAFPICEADGKPTGFIEIVEDITERKRTEDLVRQHREELAHVSRVSTVGEMASGLAHELNQPLCAIRTTTQACRRLIQSDRVRPEELGDAMDDVSLQAERAGEIIRRLRDLVRKRDPQRSTVDVNTVVREAVSFTEAEARQHGVTMQLDFSNRLPPAMADRIQIQQVVLNLLKNAIEAMASVENRERVLTIRSSLSEEDTVEILVCDTGEGLSGDSQKRLFEPFYTTKPTGMGVGLSISRSIIEAHGGRLWAGANPDHGTTVGFTLPIERDRSLAE